MPRPTSKRLSWNCRSRSRRLPKRWGGARRTIWLWLLAGILSWPGLAQAATEYEVKAAFLFNFAKFIDWPPKAFVSETSPVVVGIVGEDPFGRNLAEAVQRETVKGRPMAIHQYRDGEDFTGCHILFISRSEASRAPDILRAAQGHSILTVGESPGFAAQGGMINFVLVDKTVRFQINSRSLDEAGLKASSKLLAVARPMEQ